MMADFRKVLGVPIGIPSPKFILEIGALFMQTEPELILNSRNVVPKKLLESGFTFDFPTIFDDPGHTARAREPDETTWLACPVHCHPGSLWPQQRVPHKAK